MDEQTRVDIRDTLYRMAQSFSETEIERQRPHVMMRPALSLDGNKWIALYGEDLQSGVMGCGDSPGDAMNAFDAAWWKKDGQ